MSCELFHLSCWWFIAGPDERKLSFAGGDILFIKRTKNTKTHKNNAKCNETVAPPAECTQSLCESAWLHGWVSYVMSRMRGNRFDDHSPPTVNRYICSHSPGGATVTLSFGCFMTIFMLFSRCFCRFRCFFKCPHPKTPSFFSGPAINHQQLR